MSEEEGPTAAERPAAVEGPAEAVPDVGAALMPALSGVLGPPPPPPSSASATSPPSATKLKRCRERSVIHPKWESLCTRVWDGVHGIVPWHGDMRDACGASERVGRHMGAYVQWLACSRHGWRDEIDSALW